MQRFTLNDATMMQRGRMAYRLRCIARGFATVATLGLVLSGHLASAIVLVCVLWLTQSLLRWAWKF